MTQVTSPLVGEILEAIDDKKGLSVKVLDVRGLVYYTDYLVLCSGTSTTHVGAIVAGLRERLRGKDRPTHVNTSKDDSWWILDFVDVVVHVFLEEARQYYDLDSLWGDAKALK